MTTRTSRVGRRRAALTATALALSVGVALVAQTGSASATTKAAKAAPKPAVVVAGLNNPRGLTLAWDGSLYIAEAGKGGPLCMSDPEMGETCIGLTSSVSRVATPWSTRNSNPVRVISGLPSGGAPDGSFTVGLDGVSVRGKSVFAIETFAPPDVLPSAPPYKFMGKLLESKGGKLTVRADISAAEAKLDPDHHGFDSDPYDVLALDDRILVADAAANAVFQVRGSTVTVWAVFPDDKRTGAQFVPTSLALGPNGHVYVGGLGGEQPGAAKIVELTQGGTKLHWFNGFTTITGLGIGADGTMYVSELFANGSDDPSAPPPGQLTVVRNGHRTHVAVPFPAGIAVGSNGVYVSAWSVAPGTGLGGGRATSGQVWRFTDL